MSVKSSVKIAIKNIIFDFGGVLLEWNSDLVYLSYFDNDADKMQVFYDETQIKILNDDFDRGLPLDVGLKALSDKFPHYEKPIMFWKYAWHKMIGNKIEGSIKIANQLHKNGYQLYGLTNWSAETFPYAFYSYDFFQLFKDIVVSGREKMVKPEREIYKLCLKRNGLLASESVFIDDKSNNILAAQELGITSILFNTPEQLRSDLEALGIMLTARR